MALTGFTPAGNPQWGPVVAISSAPGLSNVDSGLHESGAYSLNVTSSNYVLVYAVNNTGYHGFHLGALDLNQASFGSAQTWKWQACPTGDLSANLGYYDVDDGGQYLGQDALVSGRNIICGFPGESWDGSEANQWFHYYDDGLFVGQFGTYGQYTPDNDMAMPYATAGFAGETFGSSLVNVNNTVYLWHNDASNHSGAHRWRLDGLNSIQEITGSGTTGSAPIALQ